MATQEEIDKAKAEVLRYVDEATKPEHMELAQAKTFIEELMTELDTRLDGLADDASNDNSGDTQTGG